MGELKYRFLNGNIDGKGKRDEKIVLAGYV